MRALLRWSRDLATVPDRRNPAITSLVVGLAIRMSGVVVPVYMVHEGIRLSVVGFIVAASGVTQLIVRPSIPFLMRRWSDRTLIIASILLLAASSLAVLASPVLPVFVVGQLLQGVSRGMYWPSSQTYVVRGKDRSASALAEINFASSVGQLCGPSLAGVLVGSSLVGSVVATGLVPLLCLPAALALERHDRLPGGSRGAATGPWRSGIVRGACWGSLAAGAWEGLIGSYVPLLLLSAGQSPDRIGLLLSGGTLGGLVGGFLAVRLPVARVRAGIWGGAATAGVALACTAVWPGDVVPAAVSLAVAGLAAGLLRTLGPSAASDAVPDELRGHAITATGTYRAVALVLGPTAVGGLVVVSTLPVAMVIASMLIAATGLPAWLWTRGGTGQGSS